MIKRRTYPYRFQKTALAREDTRQMFIDMRNAGVLVKEIAMRLNVPLSTAQSWSAGVSTPNNEKMKYALTDLWAEITEEE